MRRQHHLWASALTVALFAQAAQAQIKLPVFDPEPDAGRVGKVSWIATKDMADFQHGTLVTATLNNDTKVTGTLVRIDARNKGLYIRTTPGEAPTLVLQKDMKNLDKAVRTVAAGNTENINNPEIHRTVVWNGDQPTVTYYAPNLSPGEIDNLHRLEAAENDVARLQAQMDMGNKILDAQRSAISQNQQTRELLNALLFQEALPAARAWVPTVPFIPLPSFGNFPTEILNSAQLGMVAPKVDPVAFNQSMQNLRQAQSLAFFQNGQIVAVSTGNKQN